MVYIGAHIARCELEKFTSQNVCYKSSLANRYCYKEDCTFVHLVGTKRKKPPADHADRDDSTQRRLSQSASKSYSRSMVDNEQREENPNFLGLQTLLKSMQADFQKELKELKSHIVSQDNRISAMLPNIRQFLPPVPPMQYIPQHQIHQAPLMSNWQQFQASGC